jgi:type IV secretion system protein VirB10
MGGEMNNATDIRPSEVGAPTEVTQGTDLHQSKIPADDPRLRLDRPKARTLKRGPVLLVVGVLAALLAVGLLAALLGSSKESGSKRGDPGTDLSTSGAIPLPDVIKDPPAKAEPSNPSGGAGRSRPRVAAGTESAAAKGEFQGSGTMWQAREEELIKARGAALFVNDDEGESNAPQAPSTLVQPSPKADGSPAGESRAPGAEPGRAADPNLQEHKNDFLARAGVTGAEYLERAPTTPRSPYEVKAGSVIPTVLITGINSDLPGQVVAQVRENVYDTVTGNYLLIPQGSRLLAAYDSMVAWGQQRVLVCWNRLIRPDGSSITLDCMPGADLSGYSGFSDDVDNHWWRIIGGAVVSSFLAATAQRSQGNVTGYQPTFPQAWASGAAGSVNEAGQQLTAKNLQIQPTITIRPGFSVNVLVTKDVVIEPYRTATVKR